MYNNLLIFLVAIFLFSVDSVPDTPLLPGWQGGLLFLFLLVGFGWIAGKLFKRSGATEAAGYFQTEKQLSVCGLCFFAATLYLCDLKYYLSQFSIGNSMPGLVNVAGLLVFVLYLSLMWRAGRKNYQNIFRREYSTTSFIVSNLKANLPIVLPWIALSLLYDLIGLLPFPGVQQLFSSEWGDLLIFMIFLLFVLLFFPPLVRRLWGCRKLPEGSLKSHLDAFCARLEFKTDYYLWPLFEGRVLTAGVIGIVPGLRYILITPALIETLTLDELDAVMAHEIGHVKKRHLLLYVFLIAGFSILAGMVAEPFVYLMLSFDFLNKIIIEQEMVLGNILTVFGAVSLLIFMVVYFRYLFGYFIRNFERQADLYTLSAMGDSRAMVSAFEKIAVLSGNIRDQPNWHHFSIAERIDCLEQGEEEPQRIERHNKKVRYSLLAYLMMIIVTVFLVRQVPTERLEQQYQENFAEAVLLQKAKQEPDRALWQRMIGDLMLTKKMSRKAFEAYEKAYSMDPANPEIMNNLAWLLLTSEDLSLRDPLKALTLARGAATVQPKGYIFDTLATAYWANNLIDEAVRTEKLAMQADVSQRRFYQAQIVKFTTESYLEAEQVQETDPNKSEF
ncbi:MAG: peptidase M48 Ste24p [Desulfobulbaceae bacterium S5133MH15]|nr:MAG: peptidase M48 Ste24p [Desulfobulbaceae bacterium S5133MH15]